MGLPIEFNNPIITNSPDLNLKLFGLSTVNENSLSDQWSTFKTLTAFGVEFVINIKNLKFKLRNYFYNVI